MTSFLIISPDEMAFFVALLVILVVGWIVVVAVLKKWMRGELNELSVALYAHIQRAKEQIGELKQTADVVPAIPPAQAAQVEPPVEPKPQAAPEPAPAEPDPIPADVLVVIAAAVAHYFGAQAQIRSARLAPAPETSAWAQIGRATVQASHNLSAQRAHV